jgi:CHAD domain-containing protein
MTLELRDPGRPGESLRETLLGFADALCADIDGIASDTATRIHDIRVGTKKIRALLRLAGNLVPAQAGESAAGILRAIRQDFSGSRDAAVLRHRLSELFPENAAAAISELDLDATDAADVPDTAEARVHAASLKALLETLDFSPLTPAALAENAARSYRRARRLMKKCHAHSGDDVLMHDWRKRTKDVCYHALALAAVKPMKKQAPPLDALAESLGEYHDLSLLEEKSAGHELIASAAHARKQAVGRECFRAAKKIFRRKPSALRKKLTARLPE